MKKIALNALLGICLLIASAAMLLLTPIILPVCLLVQVVDNPAR